MNIEKIRDKLLEEIVNKQVEHLKEIDILTKEYEKIMKLDENALIALSCIGKSKIKNID